MVYKRYIKRGGKTFGPYYYESYRDENGIPRMRKVNPPKNNKKLIAIFSISLIILISFFSLFLLSNSEFSIEKSFLTGKNIEGVSNNLSEKNFNTSVQKVLISQSEIEVGKKVKWVKYAESENEIKKIDVPNFAENISLKIDKEAEKILKNYENVSLSQEKILKLEDKNFIKGIFTWIAGIFQITGRTTEEKGIKPYVIEKGKNKEIDVINSIKNRRTTLKNIFNRNNNNKIAIEYYTEAPKKKEEITYRGKKVIVYTEKELNYTDVISYSEIKEKYKIKNKEDLKILWKDKNKYVDFEVFDKNKNGYIDYVKWKVPHLSEQTFEIIYIEKASHLNENRKFVEDVYEYVKERDNEWIKIPNKHYLRVTFEENLTSDKDITIYAGSDTTNSSIEVYEKNSNNLIAEFKNIKENKKYKIYLDNLKESQNIFDLKILSLEGIDFDYVVDPTEVNISTDSINTNVTTEPHDFSHLNISDPNLVAYWSFDENVSTTKTYDYTNNSNDGDLKNGIEEHYTTSGYLGGCYDFDGTGDYIDVYDTGDFTSSDNFTIVAWIKTTSNGRIFSRRGDYEIHPNGNGQLFFYDEDWDDHGTTDITTGEWVHTAIVVGNGNVNLYVNGTKEYGPNAVSFNADGADGEIGAWNNGGNNQMDGKIDEFMIFDKALSSTEIEKIYNSTYEKFYSTGTMKFENLDFGSNSTVNITLDDCQIYNESALQGKINSGNWENFSDCKINDYSITESKIDANLTIKLLTNTSYNFYSPLVIGNVTLDSWGATGDTTKPSIIWENPTPNDGAITSNTSIYLNTTITDSSETSAWFDWNRSLVGYWAMGDYYNSTGIFDNSSYDNFGNFQGTNFGVSNITTGKKGNALEFDGVDDHIEIADDSSLDITSEITLSAWFKFDSVGSDEWQDLIFKGDFFADSGYMMFTSGGGSSNHKVGARLGNQKFSTQFSVGDNYPQANTWYHLVYTYNGTNITAYLNGSEIGITKGPTSWTNNDLSLKVGSGSGGSANIQPFTGSIDDAMIFDRALSSQEIKALYNNTANRLYNNFSNLSSGTYNYSAYAIDSNGNLNIADERNVTINSPPNQPVLNSPGNGSTGVSTPPTLNVSVTDPDGDNMNVSFYNASDNSLICQNNSISNGSDVLCSWNGLQAGTTYEWYVNVTDSYETTQSQTWNFTTFLDTNSPNIIWENPTPSDGAITSNTSIYLNTTITDSSETSAWFDWNRSLVGYWAMGDYYNSTGIFDNSSYDNFGNFQGGLSSSDIVTGKRGNALEFDGSDDAVDTKDIEMDGWTEITVSAWFKDSESNNMGRIVSKDQKGTPGAFILWIVDGPDLNFQVHDTEWQKAVYSSYSQDSNWHHAVGLLNTTGAYLFLDGNLVASDTSLGGGGIDDADNEIITIGADSDTIGAKDNLWNGGIDDVMIFDRALSSQEIKSLYDNSANRLFNNFTSLSKGVYDYSAYAIDSNGNLNIADERNVIINSVPNITSIKDINESGVEDGDVIREENVTINATVTDVDENIDSVWVKVWEGAIGVSQVIFKGLMDLVSGDLWSVDIETNESFDFGETNYTVYANDTTGQEVNESGSFEIVNSAPVVSDVVLNSSSGNNLSMDNLHGFCNATDTNEHNITYYYKWYNDSGLQFSGKTSENFTQGELINVNNLSSSNTQVGENWTFSCLASDSIGNSSWVNSSILTIEDNPSLSIINTYPAKDVDVIQNEFAPVTFNVTCNIADCGDVNVSIPVTERGVGTPISNCSELQAINESLTNDYYLLNNIDCEYETQNPEGLLYNGGKGFSPIGDYDTPFKGSFDGRGYVISGLYINRTNLNKVGLFGGIENSEIENVGLIEVNITGGDRVGAFVGQTVSGSTMRRVYSSGSVIGGNYIGGLVGFVAASNSVEDSFSLAKVNGENNVGGLLGILYNTAKLNRSYSTGEVYSSISESEDKGLVGVCDGICENSFWDNQTSGQNDSSACGTGKTTSQMQDIATFTDLSTEGLDVAWDFVDNPNNDGSNEDIWDIESGINDGYPYLMKVNSPSSGNGLVPNNLVGIGSGTPFWTNKSSNPYTLSGMTAGETREITFWLNATGQLHSVWELSGYALSLEFSSIDDTSSHWLENITAAPVVSDVVLNSSSGNNWTSEDLLGWCNATDADEHNITYYYKWYNDSGLQFSGKNSENFTQGELINVDNLSSSNTQVGENWTFSCLASDSIDNSSWVNSSILTIGDNPSLLIERIYPNSDVTVLPNEWFKVKFNITCVSGNCGDVNVSLDPSTTPIYDCQDLQDIENNLSGSYYLANDINCSSFGSFNPIGNDSNPFNGTLDGRGYSIQGLSISSSDNYVGLFGYVGNEGELKHFNLEDISVSQGESYVGTVAGYCEGYIEGVSSKGDLSGNMGGTGGFVGELNGGTIIYSYSNVSVDSSTYDAGGFIGIVEDSSISYSYSFGDVETNDWFRVGGFIAHLKSGNITNCYSTGDVYAIGDEDYSSGGDAGGFIGDIDSGIVENCYSTGDVEGVCWGQDAMYGECAVNVGGLVGNNDGTISKSYSSGQVTAAVNGDCDGSSCDEGGFVGRNGGTCSNSFWDNQTSSQSSSACSATGKTTSEMHDVATFTDLDTTGLDSPWDFENNPYDDTGTSDYWTMNTQYAHFNYPENSYKAGLISTTTGDTPFYTNKSSNPYTQTSMNQGDEETIEFWVNATGDEGTTYEFFGFATLLSDLDVVDETVHWNVTINSAPKIILNSPEDNSTNITYSPILNITISDSNGDNMNVSFYNASDDSLICQNNSITSGSDVLCSWNDLSVGTTYEWYVNVTDSYEITHSQTWNFTTKDSPNITSIKDINESGVEDGDVKQGENVTINATVTDVDEDIDSVWVKVWEGAIGVSQVIFRGLMDLVSGDLWSVDIETNESFDFGETNYTVYANDSAGNEVNESGSFEIVNSAPVVSDVVLNSSSGNNWTSEDLLGWCNATDTDEHNITYYYKWHNDSGLQFSGKTSENFTQGELINVNNLSSSNTQVGENWTFSCLASDSIDNSSWVNSSILTIEDNPSLLIERIFPNSDLNVIRNEFFNNTFNVTCSGNDCGNVNVSLYYAEKVEGTPISNCTELQNINNNLTRDYYLTQDINCSDTINWNDGEGFNPLGNNSNSNVDLRFKGSFDGMNYTINNLYINRPDDDEVGLFGYVENATISNVGVTNVDITGGVYNVAGLAGKTTNSQISSSFTSGSVNADFNNGRNVGGLIGSLQDGKIENCFSSVDVTYKIQIGGLVGYAYDTSINNSYSTGYVDGNGYREGGLVGYANNITCNNSFWDTQTSGEASSACGTGKTTSEMKDVETFTNESTTGLDNAWDFVDNPYDDTNNKDIWDIESEINNGYPHLTEIESSGEVNSDTLVPVSSGSPFYTNKSSNPFTLSNMVSGEERQITFDINATGSIGDIYEMFGEAVLLEDDSISDSTSRKDVSIVETSFAVEMSPLLSQKINWTINSIPLNNESAHGNNGTGETQYYINVTADYTTVDVYMKANRDLESPGLDKLGLGNETYWYNYTNSSVPFNGEKQLTTNYQDNKILEDVGDTIVYLKYYLDVPSTQPAGEYNNTVSFKVVKHGETP